MIVKVLKHTMLPKMYWATANDKYFPLTRCFIETWIIQCRSIS